MSDNEPGNEAPQDPPRQIPANLPVNVNQELANIIAGLDDPLGGVPIEVDPFVDLVNYSPSGDDGQSLPISTRVPISWEAMITEILDNPNAPFGAVWPRKSDFFRWSLRRGMEDCQRFIKEAKEADPDAAPADPIIDAHLFSDRTLGHIMARAQIFNKVKKDVSVLADAVELLMAEGEFQEAASILTHYMIGANAQSSNFWRGWFTKALFAEEQLRIAIAALIEQNIMIDDFLTQVALEFNVIDALPQQYDEQDHLAEQYYQDE
jgi:hypothetical protein